MTEEERKRLAVVAANVHTRWALRTNTYLVAAPDADGWREIAAAVAAEVRQQDRARIRSVIEYMCRASAYTDAVFGDGEAATDGALHALNKVLLALEDASDG